jgi:transitional endoplasmic reticulum ATPase
MPRKSPPTRTTSPSPSRAAKPARAKVGAAKKSATARKPAPKPRCELTVLWTARALSHTDTLRYFLADDTDDRSPLDALGLSQLRDDRVTLAQARRALKTRLTVLEGSEVVREGVLFRNVATLGSLLALTQAEQEVLAFAIALDLHKPLQSCFERLDGLSLRRLHELLAQVLGVSEDDVREALKRTGPLASTGLVRVATDVRRTWDDPFEVMDGLENILLTEYEQPEAILANFFRRSPAPKLTLDDFPHAHDDVALLLRFLRGALAQQADGVNVLLYGVPGTGKTELARALAAALTSSLYEVNVEAEDGSAISGTGRFSAFQLCQRMLGRRSNTLVLFDEIEDVFPDRWYSFFGRQRRSGEDKGWTNRLLEGNPVPTLWLSNEVEQIDPAFLRRFDFIFELRTPPQPVRQRILERQLTGLPARAPWIRRMAGDERLTPAHIERAARVARLSGIDEADPMEHALGRILHNSLAVHGGSKPTTPAQHDVYDLRFLNCSEDLEGLVASLERTARARGGHVVGSVCLYGPPGTGKTAFAHHLAERLGKTLHARRASDILGPFVGQTEQNIAEMFRVARDEGAVLLLDEADSFFQNRQGAMHHWEVTQVNELLVQMEQFDGLFLCSTNLYEHLDPASLRRFTLKVRFDPPKAPARWELFVRTLAALGAEIPAGEEGRYRLALDALARLTPGDFATVRRKAALLQHEVSAANLLAALEHEHKARPGGTKGALGFGGVTPAGGPAAR